MSSFEKPRKPAEDTKERDAIPAQLAAQEKLEISPALLSGKSESRMVNTFDPRTEVSADAKHVADKIVRHLWTIFVLLPVVSIILYEMAK